MRKWGKYINRPLSNLSLKVKLPLILLLSLLVVFFSTLFTARIPYAAYDVEMSNRSVQMLMLIADQLQKEMDRFGDVTFQMLGDNVLQKNLSTMYRTPVGSGAWVDASREVRMRVENFSYFDDTILAIQLLTADGTHFSATRQGMPVVPTLLPAIYQQAKRSGAKEVWLAAPTAKNMMICARNVREVNELTLSSLGVIAVSVDFAKIVARCSAFPREVGMPLSLAIYDGDTRVYASDDMAEQVSTGEGTGYARGTIAGQDVLYVSFISDSAGWKFITALPYTSITSAIQRSTNVALALSVAAMGVALLLGYLLIASVLRHIQMLLKKYGKSENGRFPQVQTEEIYRDRKDEIGELHRQFAEMASAYNRMIEENYIKQQLLLEAQFHQLRVQVQPHFLYNVLESIYCLAQTGKDEEIAAMADALSKMLRASLNDKRDIITLKEDIAIAREYLRIQTLRYGDRLWADIQVPDALLGMRIPNMTIQPLVENAVRYAAEEMLERCHITVCARQTEAGMTVTVENSGPPMDERMLEKLASGEVQPRGLGIGLINIHKRIQLAFSPRYGLRIESREGMTRVHVDLPFDEREARHDKAAAGGR